MAIFVEEFWVFAFTLLNDVLKLLDPEVSIVGISLSDDFVESQCLDCEYVRCVSLGYFKGGLLELFPLAEGHEADEFFGTEWNESGVVHYSFVEHLQRLFEFLLRVLYHTFCQKYRYLWTHFVLLLVCLINFAFHSGPVLFSVQHTVPDVGHCEENRSRLFLFQKVLRLFELLDEGEKVNGDGDGPIRAVPPFVSLLGPEGVDLFLKIK